VTLVDYRDEFAFGIDQEPMLSISDIPTFKSRWMADSEAFAIASPDSIKVLISNGFPMREVARDPQRIIVAKP
jgi:hypothetical protein